MTPLLLIDIERAVRSSWGADTCPPETRAQWSPENPARWQCLVTTLVLNDLLGGELIRGEVREEDALASANEPDLVRAELRTAGRY